MAQPHEELAFAEGDVLKIPAGVGGTHPFRMRVEEKRPQRGGTWFVYGPQLRDDGTAGRNRSVVLTTSRDFLVVELGPVSMALLDRQDVLNADQVQAMGRERGSKWSRMRDWYATGWIRPGTYVVCTQTPEGVVKPIQGGSTRKTREVVSWGTAARLEATEVWVLDADGASRLETWVEQNKAASRPAGRSGNPAKRREQVR